MQLYRKGSAGEKGANAELQRIGEMVKACACIGADESPRSWQPEKDGVGLSVYQR